MVESQYCISASIAIHKLSKSKWSKNMLFTKYSLNATDLGKASPNISALPTVTDKATLPLQ